jgi:hypothetical protein
VCTRGFNSTEEADEALDLLLDLSLEAPGTVEEVWLMLVFVFVIVTESWCRSLSESEPDALSKSGSEPFDNAAFNATISL